jgi:hypothetical protein
LPTSRPTVDTIRYYENKGLMSCCKNEEQNNQYKCPFSRDEGVHVDLITVKSLVKEHLRSSVRQDEEYLFCENPVCDIVYFSKDPTHHFETKDLKEKVTVKDRGLDVKVCYCFNHTRESIIAEIKLSGKTTVLEDIKKKMKNPGCFCEVSNPQGSCCLGNVSSWVKEAKTRVE